MIVSDNAFEKVLKENLLSRDKFRALKSFDKKQMERYIASIYRSGFEDGYQSSMECEEEKVQWEDILKHISEVKGVGEKLLNAIDEHVRSVYGDTD